MTLVVTLDLSHAEERVWSGDLEELVPQMPLSQLGALARHNTVLFHTNVSNIDVLGIWRQCRPLGDRGTQSDQDRGSLTLWNSLVPGCQLQPKLPSQAVFRGSAVDAACALVGGRW